MLLFAIIIARMLCYYYLIT